MSSRTLTSRELLWWSIGKLVGAIRDEWRGDVINVHGRGPFGRFFMRKAGLLSYSVDRPPLSTTGRGSDNG